MHPWLGSLPYDILFWVAGYLSIDDVWHLHNTSRHLRFLLNEETLCRKLVEDRASFMLEAEDAPVRGYSSAVRRIFKRRMAISMGKPASITSLGFAADAIYADGVVCFLETTHVHVLDLYRHKGDQRFAIRSLLGSKAAKGVAYGWDCLQLLSYSRGVLAFKYTDEDDLNWLMAADLCHPHGAVSVMPPERLPSTHKLFVLQSEKYLFYGTRSANRECGHRTFREWLIQGIALRQEKFTRRKENGDIEQEARSERIRLHGFAGAEIGSTAVFKIHGEHLYALTNYDSFDVIEIDFTSYYHCIRFPLAEARQSTCEATRTIFRRQHSDGPVNDGWNVLDLQVDRFTDELYIVEGRAEWPNGTGPLSRGVYKHRLVWEDHEIKAVNGRPPQNGPVENPLSKIPDLETKYGPTPILPSWHAHLEASHVDNDSMQTCSSAFTLARSRFRGYNLEMMACLELVEQKCTCRGVDAFCLQLRSMSRKALPLQPVEQANDKGKARATYDSCMPHAAERASFVHSQIALWPMGDSTRHSVMNLPGHAQKSRSVELKAWMDDRSIVYFISDGGVGKVVCLNFDGDAPVARFSNCGQSMPLLTLSQPRGRSPCPDSDPEHTRQISPARGPWDQARFDPQDVKLEYYESTWDLDDIPDAEDLEPDILERWFDWFDSSQDVQLHDL